jgi:hypothetical protein
MEPVKTFVRDEHFKNGIFVPEQEMRIFYDEDVVSPRSPHEFSNMTHMVCFHGRMELGDQDHGLTSDRFGSWTDLETYLIEEEDAYLIYPLSIYDHGGVTIFIGQPTDPWDSGQVGFVYVTKADILHEYGKLTPETEALAKRVIDSEVETYDRYLQGTVYGYKIYENGVFVDSCWGFYCDPEEIAEDVWGRGTFHEGNC